MRQGWLLNILSDELRRNVLFVRVNDGTTTDTASPTFLEVSKLLHYFLFIVKPLADAHKKKEEKKNIQGK